MSNNPNDFPCCSSSGCLGTETSHLEHLPHADDHQTSKLKQDGGSTSEPVSPTPKSPVHQWRSAKSLATLDASSNKAAKSYAAQPIVPIELEDSSLYKPFSGDLNIFTEGRSPVVSTPDEKLIFINTEQTSVNSGIAEQAPIANALETIIEGPLETISEGELEHSVESKKTGVRW